MAECFWDTSEADPDHWPVVVFRLTPRIWDRFDGRMAEFLLAMLRGDYPFAKQLIAPVEMDSDQPFWDRHYGWDD